MRSVRCDRHRLPEPEWPCSQQSKSASPAQSADSAAVPGYHEFSAFHNFAFRSSVRNLGEGSILNSSTQSSGTMIMNAISHSLSCLKLFLCGALLLALTGCVGVVGPGYYDGPGYYGPGYYGPDVTVFGGYVNGPRDRDFGRRGFESRGAAGHGGHFGGAHH